MKNIPPYLIFVYNNNKRHSCLLKFFKKQPIRAAGKMRFFENPANMTAMYSEHSQQFKKTRLQQKFCVAAFLITKHAGKRLCF